MLLVIMPTGLLTQCGQGRVLLQLVCEVADLLPP